MKNQPSDHTDSRPEIASRRTPKQLAALACIALLVLLYLATLAVAFMDFPGADRLFAALLVFDIGLPILLWIYLWLIRKVQEHRQEAEEMTGEEK